MGNVDLLWPFVKSYFIHLKKIAMRTKCGEHNSHPRMLMSQIEVDHIQSLLCPQCWRNSKTLAHLLLLLGVCHLFNWLRQLKTLRVYQTVGLAFPFSHSSFSGLSLFCCLFPSKELRLVLILFFPEISLCSPGWLKTCYVDQTVYKLPASASLVLELKPRVTMPSLFT